VTPRTQTKQFPFSVGHVAGQIRAVAVELQIDAGTVVRPRSKLHVASLFVERKPRDVDLARAHEDARRHPQTERVRAEVKRSKVKGEN